MEAANPRIGEDGLPASVENFRALDARPTRYAGLDGLRGVCALTVLLFHCNGFFYAGPVFQHGYLAVDMFFILSGFVVAASYEEKLKSGFGVRAFLRTRAARLMPVYWIGTLLGIVCFVVFVARRAPSTTPAEWAGYSASAVFTLLLLPEFFTPDGLPYPVSPVAWSLFLEWIANIFYAAGAYRPGVRTLTLMTILGWMAMTFVAFHSGRAWDVGGVRDNFFIGGTLRAVPSFLAGVVLCRWRRADVLGRLPKLSTELLLMAWIALASVPRAPGFTSSPAFDAMIVTMACPLLIALLIRSNDSAPRYCSFLGEISYPLYASHVGLVRVALVTPLFGLSHRPDVWRACMFVIVCIAVAQFIGWLAGARLTRQVFAPFRA